MNGPVSRKVRNEMSVQIEFHLGVESPVKELEGIGTRDECVGCGLETAKWSGDIHKRRQIQYITDANTKSSLPPSTTRVPRQGYTIKVSWGSEPLKVRSTLYVCGATSLSRSCQCLDHPIQCRVFPQVTAAPLLREAEDA